MMSGPEPGALPMISRIGLSGNAGCAGWTAGGASRKTAIEAIEANNLAIRIEQLLYRSGKAGADYRYRAMHTSTGNWGSARSGEGEKICGLLRSHSRGEVPLLRYSLQR